MGGSFNKHCILFPEIKDYKLIKETDSSTKYRRNDQTDIEFRIFETQQKQSDFSNEIQLIERMKKQEFKGLAKIINYTIDKDEVMGFFGGKRLCVLTELPKYTLKEYIKQYKKLTVEQIVELTTTIIGIQLLLEENNQFLGFNNIYTDDGMHWKLKLFQETNSFYPNFKKNYNDPIGFPAPEEFTQKDTPDKNRVQIFAFGMIILQLILGKPSSEIYPKCKFNEQIFQQRIDEVKANQQKYPGKFIEIFLYMLDPNLLNRKKYAQLVKLFRHHESFVNSEILSKFEYSDYIEKEHQKSKISNASKISTQIASRSAITEKIKIEANDTDIKLQQIQNNPLIELIDGNKYQGNLQDDKQDGFGQLISSSGIVLYKGSFKQGLFDGFGVQYNPNCILPNKRINYYNLDECNAYVLKYEGYFCNGKKSGNGILYYSNNELYQGEFLNDLPDGYGSFVNQNKNQFQGRWSLGKFKEKLQIHSSVVQSKHQVLSEINTILSQNQVSIIQDEKEILEKNNNMEKLTIKQGDSKINYKGELVDKKMEGKGTIYFQNNNPQYIGDFKQNLYHGLGTLHNENPQILQDYDIEDINDVFIKDWWRKFQGAFQFGMKHGQGRLYLTDNSQYVGNFINDKPVGEGFRKRVDDQYFNELWENGKLKSPILDK